VESVQLICSRCRTPLEAGDIRCSICGQSAPQQVVERRHTEVKILRCTGCGAAIAYDPKRQAPSCSFCDSVVKVETIEDPMEQTSGYAPFTVKPEQAHAALKNWLGSFGWFRPSDLRSASRLQELRPLWWVAWVFDADSMISWTADSNQDARRSSWAPHSGQTQVNFRNILASASRGLSIGEVQGISPGLDLGTVRPKPEGADDATLEQFDVQRSQARRQVVDALHYMAAQHVQQHNIPGSRFRKVNVSVVVQGLVTRRLSLPAYVLAYRYKQQLYRVVICGQDANRVIGTAPYSMAKIVLTIAAAFAAVLFVVAIIAGLS
jgi:LSD1 subclass zinc finger protein